MISAHLRIYLIRFTQYFLLLMVLHEHFLLSVCHHNSAFLGVYPKSVMLQIPISYTRNSEIPASTSIPTYRISFYKLLKFAPNRIFLELFLKLLHLLFLSRPSCILCNCCLLDNLRLGSFLPVPSLLL